MARHPDYPELVVCSGVPSFDGLTVHLRAPTEEGDPPGVDFSVAIENLVWINMPVINADIPDEVRVMLENYGMVLVVCRIAERHPGFLIVEVPAVTGAARFSINPARIARTVGC